MPQNRHGGTEILGLPRTMVGTVNENSTVMSSPKGAPPLGPADPVTSRGNGYVSVGNN